MGGRGAQENNQAAALVIAVPAVEGIRRGGVRSVRLASYNDGIGTSGLPAQGVNCRHKGILASVSELALAAQSAIDLDNAG